jgi:hypothetical protein
MATQTERTAKKTTKAATSLPGRTVLSRLAGVRPSRTRAFITACGAAIAGGTLVYRLLRSGGND